MSGQTCDKDDHSALGHEYLRIEGPSPFGLPYVNKRVA
jgi:hypothetical protein